MCVCLLFVCQSTADGVGRAIRRQLVLPRFFSVPLHNARSGSTCSPFILDALSRHRVTRCKLTQWLGPSQKSLHSIDWSVRVRRGKSNFMALIWLVTASAQLLICRAQQGECTYTHRDNLLCASGAVTGRANMGHICLQLLLIKAQL